MGAKQRHQTTAALATVPDGEERVIVATGQVVKATGVPDRFAPLCSLVIGISLAFLVMPTLATVILGGIAVGLMASGLYSGARAMMGY